MTEQSAIFWLGLNIISIVVLAFYSMMEMACVSFNRVRLHYYASKNNKKALLLNELLHNPSKLFGTTLVMVNLAMFIGSECAREFHIALGVSPDLAPLSQVIVVIILGELAPMFAARSHSEHVALLGISIIYASSKILTPVLWVLEYITRLCGKLIGADTSGSTFSITQEELQKILEDREVEQPYATDLEQFNMITSNIFSLRQKDVSQVMTSIRLIPALPSQATLKDAKILFASTKAEYLPIYHNTIANIIAIAFPRDLIRGHDDQKVKDLARVPWFVTETAYLPHVLRQFRNNTQQVAVIINSHGAAIGMINREEIIEEIFGKSDRPQRAKGSVYIDRSFPGETKVSELNEQFHITLDLREELTLGQLIEKELGYRPEVGESVYLAPFELIVKEVSLTGVKTVIIKTKIE